MITFLIDALNALARAVCAIDFETSFSCLCICFMHRFATGLCRSFVRERHSISQGKYLALPFSFCPHSRSLPLDSSEPRLSSLQLSSTRQTMTRRNRPRRKSRKLGKREDQRRATLLPRRKKVISMRRILRWQAGPFRFTEISGRELRVRKRQVGSTLSQDHLRKADQRDAALIPAGWQLPLRCLLSFSVYSTTGA